MQKYYTVLDMQAVGYTLEPQICFKCESTKHTVNLMNSVGDVVCEKCGWYQLDYLNRYYKTKKARRIQKNSSIYEH